MKFSILVPCYNEEKNIGKCLAALVSQNCAQKEIIVADDASTDRTAEVVRRFYGDGVTLVSMKSRSGKVRSLNKALKVSSGDVIVVLDGDSTVENNWLSLYSDDFADKSVLAVGGSLKGKNDEGVLVSCAVLLDTIHHILLKKFLLPCKLSGSNFAVRKRALLDVGGFDETKWPGEDLDIYTKLKHLGKVIFNPTNVVWTSYPKTLKEAWRRKYWWGYGCGLLVREKLSLRLSIWLRPVYFTMLFLCIFFSFLPFPDSIKQYNEALLISLIGSLFLFYLIMGFLAAIVEQRLSHMLVSLFLPFFFLWRELGYFFGFLAAILRLKK